MSSVCEPNHERLRNSMASVTPAATSRTMHPTYSGGGADTSQPLAPSPVSKKL